MSVGGPSWNLECVCGVVVNGVRLDWPYCRTVDECVGRVIEDYKRVLEIRELFLLFA
jgi:hypothetical protein